MARTKSGGDRERKAGPFEAQGKLKPGLFLCSGGSLDPCFSLLAFFLGGSALSHRSKDRPLQHHRDTLSYRSKDRPLQRHRDTLSYRSKDRPLQPLTAMIHFAVHYCVVCLSIAESLVFRRETISGVRRISSPSAATAAPLFSETQPRRKASLLCCCNAPSHTRSYCMLIS